MNSWDVFWFLFLFVPLTILWVIVLMDMIGRSDLVGWQKAVWAMVIIFFPWIGIFAYLIVRPKEVAFPAYKQGTAPVSQTYTPQASPTDGSTPLVGDTQAVSS